MKGRSMALAFVLALGVCTASAKADLQLYIGKNTISAEQGRTLVQIFERELEEPVEAVLQTEQDSFSQRMTDGDAPQMAILRADEMGKWADAGMLTALDGCTETLGEMAQEIVEVCVRDESLYALPLGMRRYAMAVHPAWMEKIRMAYLLDKRMHPVWYPTEIMQVLDELALDGSPGLDFWPPEESDTLCFEAFLQGTCGAWFNGSETDAGDVDQEAMEDALVFTQEMVSAEFIGIAPNRDEALRRFLSGKTAIFIDWRPEDTRMYAKEIEEGRIQILPYPSVTGVPIVTGEVVCFLALGGGDEAQGRRAKQAASLIATNGQAQQDAGKLLSCADEAEVLTAMSTLDGGATLRALFVQAIGEILAGDLPAKEAAKKIGRALAVTAR